MRLGNIKIFIYSEMLEQALKRKVDIVSRKGVREKYFREIEKEIVYV
jgi:predicted nucleotidyltransferase